MAIDSIYKRDSEIVFNSMLASIKILAGTMYKDNEPFKYHTGGIIIACLVEDHCITLLYHRK